MLAQNSDPFTYFGKRPVRVCEGVEPDDGTLSVAVLKRATQRDMASDHHPRSRRGPARQPAIARSTTSTTSPKGASSPTSLDEHGKPRAFPVQVDGDYIGNHAELELGR